jgi:hypothetical protein
MKHFIICIVMLAAVPAYAERVKHVPAAEADAGKDLELVALASPTVPKLVLHFRAEGAAQFEAQELARKDTGSWVAVVPAAKVVAPGLEYYLDAGGTPVFASAQAPHRTRVATTETAYRRARDEARAKNRRSRIHTSFEYVDYGKRANDLVDRYYRIDADFSYRLWAYPLDELRVGYTRLIGEKESNEFADCGTPEPSCNVDAGFKVAGWFEVGLAPFEGVGVDGRMMVLATQTGFSVGGRGELRVGVRDGTHVASGVEYMADVGTAGFFRFGWGTVPKTPMSATVEITKVPASTADIGVRFYYDLTRQISDTLRLGVRIGYAAREQELGGVSGGGQAIVDF